MDRSTALERLLAGGDPTAEPLDGTLPAFPARRVSPLEEALGAFLAPFDDPAFARFPFILMDLAATAGREIGFFGFLGFGFAFDTINAATYTVIGPLKSRRACGRRFAN